MKSNSKKTNNKEITLYNFSTIRNPEYKNESELYDDPNYIFYNIEDFSIKKSECEYEELLINDPDFSPKDFLDFDLLKNNNKLDFCNLEQVKIINWFNKILYLYKNKIDDYRQIYQLLRNFDVFLGDKNDIDKIKEEKLFFKKVWYAYIISIKVTNNLKQKEIATNLLKYYHLRKNIALFDFEPKDEKEINFSALINAKIIIPDSLFPKSETFYFGSNTDNIKAKQVSILSTKQHFENIHNKRLEICEKIDDEDIKAQFIKELSLIKDNFDKTHLLNKKSDQYLIDRLSNIPFKFSIISIKHKNYFFADIHSSYLGETKFLIREIFENSDVEKTNLIDEDFKTNKKYSHCIPLKEKINQITHINEFELKPNFILNVRLEFSNGKTILIPSEFKLYNFDDEKIDIIDYSCSGNIEVNEFDGYGIAYPPSGHGIKMLGIADYRKVVTTISRYVPAEVAHIENIMASEFREKVTTKELSTEITDFSSIENDSEKINEVTSNDRFKMQNEVANLLNDTSTNKFDFKTGYNNSGFFAEASTGNSTVNSKQLSNKQALENAKEITNKASEKIISKIKSERTVKITEKFIDVNKYGFDNRGHNEHVSGVYRHINAVYKNKIYNYGKRLTYEFSVPEPAKNYKLSKDYTSLAEKILGIENRLINFYEKIKSYDDLNEDNYLVFIKNYNIEDNKYEKFPKNKIKNLIISNSENNNGLEYEVESGYNINKITLNGYWNCSIRANNECDGKDWKPSHRFSRSITGGFNININKKNIFGDLINDVNGDAPPLENFFTQKVIFKETEDFNNSKILIINIDNSTKLFYSLDIQVDLKIDECVLTSWKLKTYNLLKTKYDESIKKYRLDIQKQIDDFISQEKNKNNSFTKDQQASRKRTIEINSLKETCQSYLLGNNLPKDSIRNFGQEMFDGDKSKFGELSIKRTKKLDEYTAFIRFLEQAFEWSNMSYSFYPYYWGEKKEWLKNYHEFDEDTIHEAFLKAGMSRVVVTVRPGFEEAVMFYMITGKIWNGGSIPVYGSSLFVSIAEEIKDNDEYEVEETWETILPTNLIALQSDGVAIEQSGLPDLEYQENLGKLKPNTEKLPTKNDCEENKKKKILGLFNW